jgi:FkbM family methyltransferase
VKMAGGQAPITGRLCAPTDTIKRFLSLEDLKRKRQLRLWRKVLNSVEKMPVEQIVISGKKTVLQYLDGCKFCISRSKTSNSRTLLACADYETHETELLKKIIKPGFVVIDAGASFGWFAIHFAKWVGCEGKVYAIEPVEESFRELKENVALNDCRNVEMLHQAVGNGSGLIDFYVPGIDLGSGAASRYLDMGKKLSVQLTTLDAVVKQYGIEKVDFIKMDIEGGELELLRGAQTLLMACRPSALVEIVDIHCKRFGHTPYDVYSFLVQLGYTARFISPSGDLVECDSARLRNGNYLFKPTRDSEIC